MIPKLFDKITFALGLTAILIISGLAAVREGGFIEFNPVNGHFQNFNAVHRLYLGEVPFRDFPVYLGFGALLMPFPIFAALGGELSASNTAYEFLGLALPAFTLVALIKLCRGSTSFAWPVSALLMTLPWFIARGHDSAISIRSFLPVIAALLAVGIIRLASRGLNHILSACLVGLLAGGMPLWSNDYGIPTALAFTCICALTLSDGWRKTATWMAITALAAALSFWMLLNLLTWGNPEVWLNYIKDVSSDQFWYFNPNAAGKTYGFSDIPHSGGAIALALPILISSGVWLLRARRNAESAALAILASSTLGACLLSGLAGTFSPRYAMPVFRVDFILIPWLASLATSRLWPSIRSKLNSVSNVSAVLAIPLALFMFFKFELGEVWAKPPAGSPFVSELGGAVPIDYMSGVEMGRHLKKRYDAEGVPSDRRLLSTYATATALIAGSLQKTPDYIIHALGKRNRDRFLSALDEDYKNVETIDPGTLVWGLWNVRTSWPFFRKLFINWEPVDRTGWSLIWSKRDHPLELQKAIPCVVSNGADGFSVMTVSGNSVSQDWWAEIKVQGNDSITPTLFPLAGGKGLIEAVENPDFFTPRDDYTRQFEIIGLTVNTWTAPLSNSSSYPVRLRAGKGVQLGLRAWPRGDATISATSCTATLVAPVSETMLAEKTTRLTSISYVAAISIKMPGIEPGEKGGDDWLLYTSSPLDPLRTRVGDTVVFPDGRSGIVVLRDHAHLVIDGHSGLVLSDKEKTEGGKVSIRANNKME